MSAVTTRVRFRITKVIQPDALGEQLEAPVNNLLNAIARRMQRLVPKRTWRLHDTITNEGVERNGGKVIGRVGVGGRTVRGKRVGYAIFVERGTSKQAAQPYMRPALLQSRSEDLLDGSPIGPQRGGVS